MLPIMLHNLCLPYIYICICVCVCVYVAIVLVSQSVDWHTGALALYFMGAGLLVFLSLCFVVRAKVLGWSGSLHYVLFNA